MPIAKKGEISHVSPGWYKSTIDNVETDAGLYGPIFRVTFMVINKAAQEVKLMGVFPTVFTVKNKLGRLLSGCGYNIHKGSEIEMDNIVGRILQIKVEDNEYKGETYSRIVDYRRKTPSQAEPDKNIGKENEQSSPGKQIPLEPDNEISRVPLEGED